MQHSKFKKGTAVSVHCGPLGDDSAVVRYGVIDRYEDGYCFGRFENGGPFCSPEAYVYLATPTEQTNIENFKAWVKQTEDYPILLSVYGGNVFNRDMGEFCNLPIRLAYTLWLEIHGAFEA